ncbi:hypothetical protein M422DRAFT_781450 [Sphaerobolus stellatus SS14]|uniref:F-box domain-containing protein n=1 Tax=Sphaerobolus stellatus (strain SS14) TaxID=990650 RepID=A0A0C9U6B7_SPHS4|nr:hypothetical protein M422DRAFT_781450 [Sphaerobolus stellatus SS14]
MSKSVAHFQSEADSLLQSKSVLLNLPLEVLIVLFRLLWPIDLLRLARSCRMHAFLGSTEFSSIWRNFMKNLLNFPDCLSYFIEQQYANFMFDLECQAPGAEEQLPILSAWMCKQCYETNILKGTILLQTGAIPGLTEELLDYLPETFVGNEWSPEILLKRKHAFYVPAVRKFMRAGHFSAELL